MSAPVAEKVLKKKVAASQATKKAASSTARAGEKSIASREKTSGPGSPKNEVSSAGESGAPAQKPTAAQRATSGAKSSGKRRVESAKQSHQKTAAAVDSKKRKEKVLGIAEMRPKTRMLAAEYMAAIVMAVIMLFLQDGEKSYSQRMSRFFIQMTGITGIFFVLALASSSERVSRYAIPFGLLIDTSMLIYLFKQGGAKVIDALTGNATTDYAEVLHTAEKEEGSHSGAPTLIAPGLIVTPGNVGVIGGNLGGPVTDPGVITTPGNKGVLTPHGGTPN